MELLIKKDVYRLYYLKFVFSQVTELTMKKTSLTDLEVFPFCTGNNYPLKLWKMYRTKIFRCTICVKSNFINVNSCILLFSFISNYEDGQNRIIQSLKPTRISSPVKKYMLKVNNRNIDNRDAIDVVPMSLWLNLNMLHTFCFVSMMTLNLYLFSGRDISGFDSQ